MPELKLDMQERALLDVTSELMRMLEQLRRISDIPETTRQVLECTFSNLHSIRCEYIKKLEASVRVRV